jgi:protocatechuate 3,4-dioxygenase beta subunit
MVRLAGALLAAASLLATAGLTPAPQPAAARAREPVVGLPCEGCDAVFEGLPAELPSVARIAPESEPGEALRIEGTVLDRTGKPVAGVIVYAYHTDDHGIYPTDERLKGTSAHRHGRLRGWVTTDGNGRYRFDTIRPAGYPNTDIPSHVHMHVIEVGRCTYYIDDLLFDDDPRLTPQSRRRLAQGRGGPGVAVPRTDGSGGWIVTRDILLGEKIPGYPAD